MPGDCPLSGETRVLNIGRRIEYFWRDSGCSASASLAALSKLLEEVRRHMSVRRCAYNHGIGHVPHAARKLSSTRSLRVPALPCPRNGQAAGDADMEPT